MKRPTAALVALALSSAVLSGCGDRRSDTSMTAMTDLLPERIAGYARGDPSITYDRETIFDYINGAGEVYNSYAFRQVLAHLLDSGRIPAQ